MKNIGYIKKINSIFMIMISLFTVTMVVFLVTVAYFISNAWASNNVTLAGPVEVYCVGGSATGYTDIAGAGNLEISIPDITNTTILIPNMPVGLRANAKIAYAKSIALLRAKVEVVFENKADFPGKTNDDFVNLGNTFVASLEHSDTVSSGWFKYQNYWYYVGSNLRSGVDTRLVVIDHTPAEENTSCDHVDEEGNSYVKFIDNDFRIPKDIDSSWSGLEVVVRITFEAIQGFIPNVLGYDIGNANKTINAALPIFNNQSITE